jgi:hypothetical protein
MHKILKGEEIKEKFSRVREKKIVIKYPSKIKRRKKRYNKINLEVRKLISFRRKIYKKKFKFLPLRRKKKRLLFLQYRDYHFEKFILAFMQDGLKKKIEKLFINFLVFFKIKYKITPLLLFYELIDEIRTPFFLITRRRGLKLTPIPVNLPWRDQYLLSIKWFSTLIKFEYLNMRNKNFQVYLIQVFEELLSNSRNKDLPRIVSRHNSYVNLYYKSYIIDNRDLRWKVKKKYKYDRFKKYIARRPFVALRSSLNIFFKLKYQIQQFAVNQRFRLHYRWRKKKHLKSRKLRKFRKRFRWHRRIKTIINK